MDEELKSLLKQNQETLGSLDKRIGKIERHFKIEAILNMIKWLIIVVPIVFGIIYISPYVKHYVQLLQPALKALNLESINDMLGNTEQPNGQNSPVNGLQALCDPAQRQAIINQYCK